ncbi:MAG: PAS domain S-box protein [Tenuifilaceae bacterium]|jgi:PAS domain S-box-containing protein|nr:PAS domain S-box protein [Tenuifilaceae bacterium]
MSVIAFSVHDLPNAAFITTRNGEIIEHNSGFSSILGFESGDLLGKQVYSLVSEDDTEKLKSLFASIQDGRSGRMEITVYSKTHHLHTFEFIVSSLNTSDTSAPNFLIQANNVTHFRRVKDELNEQRRLHKTLVQNLPGMMYRCMYDRDWTMEFISSRCLEITGYRPEDLVDNRKITFNELIHVDYRDRIREQWERVLSERKFFTLEYPIYHASGELRWVWEQGVGVYNSNDELVALEGIIFDVSGRKKAEEALSGSEAIFRKLVENAFDGIYLIRNQRVEYVNQRFVDITGYSFAELTEESFDLISILTEESQQFIRQIIQNRTDGIPSPSHYELDLISKSGQKCEVEVSSASIAQGNDILVLGIVRNISERKLAQQMIRENEEQLKLQNEKYIALNNELTITNERIVQMNQELLSAKQKVEEHDRLKSAFLANMSHEIRTPMNGILGFSQLLLSKDLSHDEHLEYIEIIQNCGHQLLAIINDLIDISKIEANQISLETRQVSLNSLMNEQFLLFHAKALSLNLEFENQLGLPNEEPIVELDDARLRQVFSHIIGNALKFTTRGKISFGYNVQNGFLQFFVKDTGVGIPSEMLAPIFERFRQVEMDLSRQAGGTGVGLSISKALVEKMGGQIWVESVLGEGSTFFFTIPLVRVDKHITHQNLEERVSFKVNRNPNIIIADDNEINYMYLRELLRELSPDLTWATNGQEVVELVRANPDVNLILMDIKMPVMDGYEATREVKKLRPNLPVVAQTAYALSGDREDALAAGCDDYISKPINKGYFHKMIERLLKIE